MKIGIEGERANHLSPTGVERYATELIKNLAKLDKENEYVLYFRTEPQEWFKHLPPNFKLRVIPFPKFWTQTRLTLELLLHPVDVFVLPIQALPFLHPRNSIITVHDVAYEIFPQAFAGFMLFYLKLTTRWGVWRAKKIIAVSESTKKDVVKFYGADPDKITPVHLGVDSQYKPLPYDQVQAVLDKYGLSYKKYILFVGTMQPRKNIVGLVEAFEKLKKDYRIEEKLVLVGGKGWLWEAIIQRIETSPVRDSIKIMDYVPVADLPTLYNGAIVETLPALYEGFGLPPLEAMACGTPVVVSDISSLPEVVGDAGVLVKPSDSEALAQGLLKVLVDPNLREEMSRKGIERAKRYTWESCARKILDVINSFRK
ncbi:MAG: glycosyltransferase family 4 protein [Candidatus Doudnabacteria bacterium]|nr:glycosyltransferase family 4 protein [Candidatus Doudnabacteria bacterium]